MAHSDTSFIKIPIMSICLVVMKEIVDKNRRFGGLPLVFSHNF
jgi:hypothetical protein